MTDEEKHNWLWLGMWAMTKLIMFAYIVCSSGACAGIAAFAYAQTNRAWAVPVFLFWTLTLSYVGLQQLRFSFNQMLLGDLPEKYRL